MGGMAAAVSAAASAAASAASSAASAAASTVASAIAGQPAEALEERLGRAGAIQRGGDVGIGGLITEVQALVQRKRHCLVGVLGSIGILAVLFGVALSFWQDAPPQETRHLVSPTAFAGSGTTTTETPGSRVMWLGAPARLWQTARDTGEFISAKADVLFVPDFKFTGPVVNISAERAQMVSGFGAAFSEASARVFRELPPDQQQRVLEGYFGPDGIGYTLGRIHLTGDFDPNSFEGDWMREKRVQIPFLQAANKLLKAQGRRIQLLATQWSTPAWMKTNAKMFQPAHPCLRTRVSQAWADYFVEWVSAYHNEGLPIWAVTVQHGSDSDALSGACLLTPEQEADFLGSLLGPRLRAAHPDVRVFFSQTLRYADRWAALLRSNPAAIGYAVGITFQGSTEREMEALARMQREMPKAQLLASESLGLRRRWRWHRGATAATGDWSLGEGYAHDILGDLNAGSAGWLDWNLLINDERVGPNHVDNVWDAAMNLLVDDEHEDNVWDAAMMADLKTGEVHFHPQYYFIGHFSKFILPGSVRLQSSVHGPGQGRRRRSLRRGAREGAVAAPGAAAVAAFDTCSAEDGLQSTTFSRPDGFLATVVLNCGDQAVDFKIQQGQRAARATIPPHAAQTYLFEERGNSPFRDLGGVPFIGVNFGGWLLLEEWMWASEMTEKGIRDEWTLIQQHGGPQSPDAKVLMEEHWRTFVSEEDVDVLLRFGITHVRVPVGYWLVDYDPADGFVDGGEYYLARLLRWLSVRGMRCMIDLHALPGGQTVRESFTGKVAVTAEFFLKRRLYERGKRAMLKLAQLILAYERDASTAGVVFGLELVNEPAWKFWDTSPGIRELYEEMVPQIRRLLPPERYAIFLNFMESPRTTGSEWLVDMRRRDPVNYASVVYDAHVYHSFGDDNQDGRLWNPLVDSCKTCCRDPSVLEPIAGKSLPMLVGEWSLNTGFPGNPSFYLEYFRNQLSLWASLPGVVGSFFWNHRILREPGGWYKEMSLLDLLAPKGPLPPLAQLNVTVRCPGVDLSRCPRFKPRTTLWNEECAWNGDPDIAAGLGVAHQQTRREQDRARTHKGGIAR